MITVMKDTSYKRRIVRRLEAARFPTILALIIVTKNRIKIIKVSSESEIRYSSRGLISGQRNVWAGASRWTPKPYPLRLLVLVLVLVGWPYRFRRASAGIEEKSLVPTAPPSWLDYSGAVGGPTLRHGLRQVQQVHTGDKNHRSNRGRFRRHVMSPTIGVVSMLNQYTEYSKQGVIEYRYLG